MKDERHVILPENSDLQNRNDFNLEEPIIDNMDDDTAKDYHICDPDE